jgi:hypothetical protein
VLLQISYVEQPSYSQCDATNHGSQSADVMELCGHENMDTDEYKRKQTASEVGSQSGSMLRGAKATKTSA